MKNVLLENWKSLLIAIVGIGFSITFLFVAKQSMEIISAIPINNAASYKTIANRCIKIDYDGNLISSPSDCSKVSGVIVGARIPER